ncbi:MAG: hypothetical protein V1829_00010 [bacterium]
MKKLIKLIVGQTFSAIITIGVFYVIFQKFFPLNIELFSLKAIGYLFVIVIATGLMFTVVNTITNIIISRKSINGSLANYFYEITAIPVISSCSLLTSFFIITEIFVFLSQNNTDNTFTAIILTILFISVFVINIGLFSITAYILYSYAKKRAKPITSSMYILSTISISTISIVTISTCLLLIII